MPDPNKISYDTTPAAFYAWQMNSYKKGLLKELISRIKDERDIFQKVFFNFKFPYGSGRRYAYIVKAKSGLKWFNVRRDLNNEKILNKLITKFNKKYLLTGYYPYTLAQLKTIYNAIDKGLDLSDIDPEFDKEVLPGIPISKRGDLAIFQLRTIRFSYTSSRNQQTKVSNFGAFIYFYLDREFSNRNFQFRDFLAELGYDAIRDDGANIIFDGEPAQVGFLSRKSFTHVATVDIDENFVIRKEQFDDVIAKAKKVGNI